jgi:uncharacterized protein YbcI
MTSLEQEQQPPTGGELNAAIAAESVRIHKRHVGRGPETARALFRDNVVVVLLQDALTRGERLLATHGGEDAALLVRDTLNQLMRDDLTAMVESLTGRTVVAFLPGSQLAPDYTSQVFVLDGRVGDDPDARGRHMRLVG